MQWSEPWNVFSKKGISIKFSHRVVALKTIDLSMDNSPKSHFQIHFNKSLKVEVVHSIARTHSTVHLYRQFFHSKASFRIKRGTH